MANPPDPALARWKAELADLSHAFADLCSPLTEEQRRWKEHPKTWSVAECIEHLRTTNAAYRPNLEAAIAEGNRKDRQPGTPYAPSWFGRWFLSQLDPARSRRRLPAPALFRPISDGTKPNVLEGFLEEQQILARLISEAEGIDLNRSRLSSPAARILKLSVGEAFEAAVLHERRHLLQAQRVPKKTGFPLK